jgi:LPXTG-motif cell wall-anchored protein
MAKKKKGRKAPKAKGNTWLLTGGLVLLVAAAGLYFLARGRPSYGKLSDIGKGKPAIVDVFLPT